MSELFAEKVVTNRRTYFFDVKETKEGTLYLVIGEVTQVGSELERHRVMVFEENLDLFLDGLEKAARFIQREGDMAQNNRPEPRNSHSGQNSQEFRDHLPIRQMLEKIERSVSEIRSHFK